MGRWTQRLLFAAALGLLGLTPLAALGNPAYEAAHERARVAFEAGRFLEAANAFKEAFEAEPRGNLLYNIGFCYEKAGDTLNAVTFYERFMEAVPGSPKRPALQRHVAELKQQLQGEYEDVSVSSSPPGANIFVDDKSRGAIGQAPTTFRLLPGNYTIIAEMQGHETVTRPVTVQRGAPVIVDVQLISSARVGTLNLLVSERDADVMIGGKRIGKSPMDPLRLPAGTHEVMVMKPGFGVWKREIELPAGKTVPVQVSLEGEGGASMDGVAEGSSDTGGGGGLGDLFGGKRLWPTVTIGAGMAVCVGAVMAGLSANNLHDQLEEKRKNGEPIARSDIDTGNSLRNMTNALWGAGGAAIIGGGVWWWMAGRGGGLDSAADLGVGMGPSDGPGLQVWGAF